MKVDCSWISENLEAFFCDRLSPEEDRHARTHIESCAKCNEEIRSFNAIDPLIRNHFRHQLTLARNRRRRPLFVIYGGAAAVAIAAALLVALVLRVPELERGLYTGSSQPQMTAAPAPAPPPAIVKDDTGEAAGITRVKPAETSSPDEAGPAEDRTSAPNDPEAPALMLIDPAGYSRTLQDFRGYTLIMGVWSSEDAEAIAAIERVYQTFNNNAQLRIVGVSNVRQPKPANTTFPIAFNQGSRLLGAKTGEFIVVDSAGKVTAHGSLTAEDPVKAVRTALDTLGIR